MLLMVALASVISGAEIRELESSMEGHRSPRLFLRVRLISLKKR